MSITRRGVQISLGVFWLFAGALQLQPFMFGSGFAHQVIAPAADGQPAFVATGVTWAASLVAAHPVLWDSLFAGIQLALGLALVVRPLARVGLIGSVLWGLGVWYLGAGLGGLASGHADLLTGAPGAVLLYVVLALAVFPRPAIPLTWQPRQWARVDEARPPAGWVPAAWAVLWTGAALLRALPGQHDASALTAEISAGQRPGWLAAADRLAASTVRGAGAGSVVLLVIIEALIGLLALRPGALRAVAAWAGAIVAVLFWVVGQGVGQLASGQATDPNTGPLIVLFAVALLGCAPGVPGSQRPAQARDREEPVGADADRDAA